MAHMAAILKLLRNTPFLWQNFLEHRIFFISNTNRGNMQTKASRLDFQSFLLAALSTQFLSNLAISSTHLLFGYGHVTPLSEGGKLFCIVYALIGIPITLILLSAFVERLMVPSTKLLQYMNLKLGHYHQAFNIRLLHLFIVVVVIVIFFFLIPAAIFTQIEKSWNYLDSLYYCFISLTTIGLGDYIPGDNPDQSYRALYKVGATVFLFVGVTFMMAMLSVLADIPQLNVGLFFLLKSDESTNDPEKTRLHSSGGMKYTQQIDEPNITTIRHIKAVPDPPSSSPDEME
ncbi:Potassium channel subfamily K member 1 [Nymphon striatum]|nr:Potassium channel subfamily K member 1 [Nymphon striatum]